MSRFAFLLLPAIAIVSPLSAHDTWITPDRFVVRPPSPVTLSLTSGMEFPKLDHPIQGDRIADARVRTSRGRGSNLAVSRGASNALELTARLTTPGVTTFWVVLHPRPSQLKPEQVREYVEHLGLAEPQRVIAEWERKPDPKAVRYRYTKYAKTFVRVGEGTAGQQWRKPAGLHLELVPEDDPTTTRAGSPVRFILLQDDRPVADYPVYVVREGSAEPARYRTDEQGRVLIDFGAAGAYMVRATTLEPSRAPDTAWDVHFTTVTVDVR